MTRIVSETIVFENENMQIEQGQLEMTENGQSQRFTRSRLNRTDASVVLVHNTEKNTIVLVKQFRYAIAAKSPEPILEIVAGKLDEGEAALEAAIRETAEESGYQVRPDKIRHLASFFVSPGYTSERFYLFYATVSNADRVSAGGGLEAEDEYIHVVELDVTEFLNMANTNAITDGKTLIAALHLERMLK